MPIRATFHAADCQFPPSGSQGFAWPAGGFDDPESAEHGAYLFQPDGDDSAYYCDPITDLTFAGAR